MSRRGEGILAGRVAEKLRELAAEAVAVGARKAGALLRAHAKTLDTEMDLVAVRRVARACSEVAKKLDGQRPRPRVAAIWARAAYVAKKPRALAAYAGFSAMTPEARRAAREAGSAALRAMPAERHRAKARKAAATMRRRGTHRSGARHPMAKLTAQKVAKIRALWAQWVRERPAGHRQQRGRGKAALGALFGVSREAINNILAGRTWKDAP